jgi:hypothetical protein
MNAYLAKWNESKYSQDHELYETDCEFTLHFCHLDELDLSLDYYGNPSVPKIRKISKYSTLSQEPNSIESGWLDLWYSQNSIIFDCDRLWQTREMRRSLQKKMFN